MRAADPRQHTRRAPQTQATMDLMTTCEQTGAERQVMSSERVRDLGEVFTPAALRTVIATGGLTPTWFASGQEG